MTVGRLNVLSAILAFAGCVALLALRQNAAVLVWLGASLVWMLLAIRGSRSFEPRPAGRVIRRLSRLLWWS